LAVLEEKPIPGDSTRAQIQTLNRIRQELTELVAEARDLVNQSKALLEAQEARRPRPVLSWRYRFLLMAVGSATVDGDDLSVPDRLALEAMDCELQRRAARFGEEAAERMLAEIIHLLEGGSLEPGPPRH
jgi:hypothetical protein